MGLSLLAGLLFKFKLLPNFSDANRADGRILVSGSADETIKVGDVHTGECLQTLRPPGPYQGMNLSVVTGLTEAQKAALKALGAVETI